ncbi:MAG: phosphatase PAP2 family protein [Bacteroidia bacterium]|nr:phosphatase PAP2 family protein [Bacteroidia bacterium]
MKIFKEKILLLSTTILLIALAFLILNTANPIQFHRTINSWVGKSQGLDNFFYYIDKLGEGAMALVVLAILLFMRFSYFLIPALALLFSSITVNVLKYWFFPDAPRPWYIFQWILHEPLKTVHDTELMILRSFPSGHAAQCFALFFSFSLIAKNKVVSLFWLLLACLGAFSRVYLSQHWWKDITAGACIGIFFSILAWMLYQFKKTSLPWIEKSVLDFIMKRK